MDQSISQVPMSDREKTNGHYLTVLFLGLTLEPDDAVLGLALASLGSLVPRLAVCPVPHGDSLAARYDCEITGNDSSGGR